MVQGGVEVGQEDQDGEGCGSMDKREVVLGGVEGGRVRGSRLLAGLTAKFLKYPGH